MEDLAKPKIYEAQNFLKKKTGQNQEIRLYENQCFITLYVTLSSLRTSKLSTKFFESYKSLINYQKHLNIKDKIRNKVHFDNTFIINEQKR